MPRTTRRKTTRRSTSRATKRYARTGSVRRRRAGPTRRPARAVSRRSSGGVFKLVIQQAPATPSVNPLTEPLMQAQKLVEPKKAKF